MTPFRKKFSSLNSSYMVFLDIHTHSAARNDSEIIRVRNLRPNETISPNTFCSIGIHPWSVPENYSGELLAVREGLNRDEVVALGECGLDKVCSTPYEKQRKAFLDQIDLSEEFGMPVLLHIVRAWDDLLAIKKQVKPSQPWIVHGFRGSEEQARQLIRAGLFLSFGCRFSPEALRLSYESGIALLETDENIKDIREWYYEAAECIGCSLQELQRHTLALGAGLFPRLRLHKHFSAIR
ncbi:TatD family hydrolase [Porphyromonas gingivalis]|uniref:TatD family hydrolase n=2 Tax=Porphyromonas gingivalis TaxID=837 RepID=UPI000B4E6CCA|nr:TatD family hydrolase [Porphyromonas gingivalis]RZQ67949.1 hydrolase TatD [Porphyromonas gingivalis]